MQNTSRSKTNRGTAGRSEPHGPSDRLGTRLRALRAKACVTRKQLAAASNTSERYLAHLETSGGNPSLVVLEALAEALDVAVADLLPRGGERSEAYAHAAEIVRRLPEDSLPGLVNWIRRPGRDGGQKASRIVLIGLRGAGKTSLGKELASRLAAPFVEMSKEVERAYGGDIGLLIEISGQAALRRYEREAWDAICQRHAAAVIAASGGVVADAELFEHMLVSAHSIWLSAAPEDHMARVMAQGDFRPMASNRRAMTDLKAILEARSTDYARAGATLDTSKQDFAATARLLEKTAKRLLSDA